MCLLLFVRIYLIHKFYALHTSQTHTRMFHSIFMSKILILCISHMHIIYYVRYAIAGREMEMGWDNAILLLFIVYVLK